MVYKNEGMMVLNKGICEVYRCTNNSMVSSQLIVLHKIRLRGIDGNTKINIYASVFSNIFKAALSPIT